MLRFVRRRTTRSTRQPALHRKFSSALGWFALGMLAAALPVAARDTLVSKLFAQLAPSAKPATAFRTALVGESALWLNDRIYRASPANAAPALERVAEAYVEQKHFARAQQLYESALRAQTDPNGLPDPRAASLLFRLGDLHGLQGHTDQAEAFYRKAADLQRSAFPENDPRRTQGLLYLANFYASEGKTREAEQAYLNTLGLQRLGLGEQHPVVAETSLIVADFYADQGELDQAERFYKLAVNSQDLAKESIAEPGLSSILLARFYDQRGKAEAAGRAYAQGAVALAKAYDLSLRDLPAYGDSSQPGPGAAAFDKLLQDAVTRSSALQTAQMLKNKAEILTRLRLPEARAAIEESIEIHQRILGADHPLMPELLLEHAGMLHDIGDDASAAELEARVRQLRTKSE